MNIWLRLSATFHEHPKMLGVRKDAKARADSAELGWYRLLMAAKRYGRWSFASEEHLEHVAGPYYRFVGLYRKHRLLDDLTVHDGESYNAVKTPAERKEEQRQRDKVSRGDVTSERDTERDIHRDRNVTLEEREERDRESRESDAIVTPSNDFDSLDTYYELTLYRPWGSWSGDKLRGAIADYGDAATTEAMRAEHQADADRATLLDRTLARLARNAEKAKRERKERPRPIRPKADPAEVTRITRELMVVDKEAS